MKNMILNVSDQNPVSTLAEFLRSLLEQKVVDALLVPQEVKAKNNVVPTLVKNADALVSANPLAPVSMYNTAKLVSDLTFNEPEEKIGVVLRPCEIRALIELVKLKQANLDKVVIIGVDCLGTFDPTIYRSLAEEGKLNPVEWATQAVGGDNLAVGEFDLRRACQMCDSITPENAQIGIGWVGNDITKQLSVQVTDDLCEIAASLGLQEGAVSSERVALIARLKEKRAAARDLVFKEFEDKYNSMDALTDAFATCLRCQNCRKACPICFCRQCVFESSIFEHDSEKYIKWASRKGLIEMPTDTTLFHLTRLNHMGLSCVGCGQCESACPSELPLSILFRVIGKKVQGIFDYVPGRDLEEKLPLTTYKEAELDPR